jgi:hypothetical protein
MDASAVPAPLNVEVLPELLSICRLPASAALPEWAAGAAPFCSVTRTSDELSIICATGRLPSEASSAAHAPTLTAREDGWRALKLVGPFAFTEVGVLLRVAAPLAAAGVSILPVATFETDYVLVQEVRLETALATLRAAGHAVVHRGDGPARVDPPAI